MYAPFRRSPQFGSTDWAARKIRAMLDEEDRRRAAPARRAAVQTAESTAVSPPVPPHKPAAAPAYPLPPVKPEQTPSWRQDERANRIIDEILGLEGGFANRPRHADPGGTTNIGITQATLDQWHANHPGHRGSRPDDLPIAVGQLTRDQAARILKEGFYDGKKLGQIDDERLAHQLMDIFTMTSPRGSDQAPGGALQIVQRAVNDVMTHRGLYNRHEQPFEFDHPADPVGPRTIDRLNWLVSSGYGPELRNALIAHRFGYASTQQNLWNENLGWNDRFNRFMEWQHTPFGRRL